VRTFIAIPLPSSLHRPIQALTGRLRRSGADVKWVEEGNYHVTLRFLGEVAPAELTVLSKALQSLTSSKSFPAQLGEVGAFPSQRSPRVIWVGFQKGGPEMGEIAHVLEEELRQRGFPPETRPFHAHLTLGRQRTPHNLDPLVNLLVKEPPLVEPAYAVREIVLFSSSLTPQGPIYQQLESVKLKEEIDGH
jgi:2'-5' RNA ligase